MAAVRLTAVNHTNHSDVFTLSAPSNTEVLGFPVMEDAKLRPFQFTAPITKCSLPSASFRRARVTIHWPNTKSIEWDQAGLLFVRPSSKLPEPSAATDGDVSLAPGYVKLGLEHFRGQTLYAVGASNHKNDWSLWPLQSSIDTVTVEFLRYGTNLVASIVEPSAAGDEKPKSTIIRLIPWPFLEVKNDEPDIWIGIYAARPDHGSVATENFKPRFESFEIETTSGSLSFDASGNLKTPA